LFNCIGFRGREANNYPRHAAAYGGLACEKFCKGRKAYNRRILCEVAGDDEKKKRNKN
jgi:hypothetical protein